jgi:WD40 repeat protein
MRDDKVVKLVHALESGGSMLITPRRAAKRLARMGSWDAVHALAEALANGYDDGVVAIARRALSAVDSQRAIDAACDVWSYRRSDELDQLVEQNGWIASHPPYVRARTALRAGRPEVLENDELVVGALIDIADRDREAELRARAAAALAALDDQDAREQVCSAAIDHGTVAALEAAVAGGFAPRDPGRHAVLLFLAERFDDCHRLDFDGRLLRAAHESAEPPLRRRLAAVARKSGRLDWVRAVSLDRSDDRLAALSDDEWATSRALLVGARRWADLWRLAVAAPPVWAAEFLRDLGSSGWRPHPPTERADYDALIRLAERCDRYPVNRLLTESPPVRAVRALTVSDDGGLLAAGSDEGEITLWRLPEVRQLRRIDASPGTVTCLAVSPDGDTLVSAGSAGMKSWRLPNGAETGHAGVTRAEIMVALDSKTLFAVPYEGHATVRRIPTLRELRKLDDSDSTTLEAVATPDRKLVAGVRRWGVRLWQLPSGQALPSISGDGPLALAPDGSLLACTSARRPPPPAQHGEIVLWRLPSGEPAGTLSGHDGNVTCLAITPDGSLLASAGREGTVRLWRLPSGEPAGVFDIHESPVQWGMDHADEVRHLAVTSDSRFLISGSRNGRLRAWRLPSGEPVDVPEGLAAGITALAVAPSGYVAAASAAGAVRLWQPAILPMARTPARRIDLADVERLRAVGGAAGLAWVELMSRLAGLQHRHDVEIDDAAPTAAAADIEVSDSAT